MKPSIRRTLFAMLAYGGGLVTIQIPLHAHATTASDLLASCEAVTRSPVRGADIHLSDEAHECWGYMTAVHDMLGLADPSGKSMLRVCMPLEMRTLQLVQVFADYARRNPSQLHYNAGTIAISAIWKAFPCP
jgi:hypothetical protein